MARPTGLGADRVASEGRRRISPDRFVPYRREDLDEEPHRIGITKRWESLTAMPSVFGGPGIGAQKAAYQISIVAETAAMHFQEFAAGLLDLVKAFETVPHSILAALAHECGYPLVILRLCLAAYRLKRSVGVDGVYSKLVVATRGITAGAAIATTELKRLLLPMMNNLHERWASTLVAKLYVDDLTLLV